MDFSSGPELILSLSLSTCKEIKKCLSTYYFHLIQLFYDFVNFVPAMEIVYRAFPRYLFYCVAPGY